MGNITRTASGPNTRGQPPYLFADILVSRLLNPISNTQVENIAPHTQSFLPFNTVTLSDVGGTQSPELNGITDLNVFFYPFHKNHTAAYCFQLGNTSESSQSTWSITRLSVISCIAEPQAKLKPYIFAYLLK